MLADIFRHWRYFIPRYVGYGTVLGGLFGALTYPIFGAFVGAPWGFFGGLLLGILTGIGVPIYNRFFADDNTQTYHSQLTFGAGFVTIAVMAVPLLFIYSLVAGLVSAYIMHQYAENPSQLGEKRKHTVDRYQKRDRVFTQVANAMMSKARYFVGIMVSVAMLGYIAVTAFDPFTVFSSIELLFIAVGGLIYGFVIASIISAVNGLFIVMANRLFFDPNMPKAQYKARLVPTVGVLTLFLSMIVTGFIGAPFAGIVGALGASKFADWYYDVDQEEKAKRSTDNLIEQFDDNDQDDDYAYEIDDHPNYMSMR